MRRFLVLFILIGLIPIRGQGKFEFDAGSNQEQCIEHCDSYLDFIIQNPKEVHERCKNKCEEHYNTQGKRKTVFKKNLESPTIQACLARGKSLKPCKQQCLETGWKHVGKQTERCQEECRMLYKSCGFRPGDVEWPANACWRACGYAI